MGKLIEELNFSVRTYNCLKREKNDTVEQLQEKTDAELMSIRCFGKGCLKEVRGKLGQCTVSIPQRKTVKSGTFPVAEELKEAIEILQTEYEKAKNNSYVWDPVCWALYHAWEEMDRKRTRRKEK